MGTSKDLKSADPAMLYLKSPDVITREKVRIWYPRTVGYLCGQRQGKPSKRIFHKSKGGARKCIGIVGTAHTILVNYPHYHPRYPPKLDQGAFCVRRVFPSQRLHLGQGFVVPLAPPFFRASTFSLPRPFFVLASGVCMYLLSDHLVDFDIESSSLH